MNEHELGTVIARREFDCGDEKIILEIGMPHEDESSKNWFCPVRIIGLDDDQVRSVGGVDAIQALHLAMQIAATILYTSEQHKSGRLIWLSNRNLQLPFSRIIADLVPPEDE